MRSNNTSRVTVKITRDKLHHSALNKIKNNKPVKLSIEYLGLIAIYI